MKRASLAAAIALSTACASTSPKEPFRDVSKEVAARSSARIQWGEAGDDPRAIDRRVADLLARELTAESAVQIAVLQNRGLRATFEELSIAQSDLVQAGLLANPSFQVGVSFPVAGRAVRGFDVGVSEDLMSVFLLAARKKMAASALDAAKARVGDAVLGLEREAKVAYLDLVAAQQTLAMRRTILEAEDAARDLATQQRDAGNISELDLANQQALFEQVQTDVARSEGDVVATREALTRVLGVSGAEAAYAVGAKLPEMPAETPSEDHLEALAIRRRLDLQAAHAMTQTLALELAAAKNFRFLAGATGGARYEKAPEGYRVAGPTAGVELPIFDQKQAVIARYEAELRRADAREVEVAIGIRSEVRSARARLAMSARLVGRYATVVLPMRERIVALSQQQYNAMLLGAYQLLAAKQAEVNAYREFIEALRDYWVARADLERATGGAVPMKPEGPTP